MGPQLAKQSKYTEEFPSLEAKEKKIIQSILSSNATFSSSNTRSISDITAFRETGYFEVQELRVIQKYCKKLKVFVESRELYEQECINEICQMQSLEELKVRLVDQVEVMDAIRQFTQLKNLKSLCVDDERLTYEGLVELAGLFPDLESLSIKIGDIEFPETMLSMLQGMKNLKTLILNDAKLVNKQLLNSIVKTVPGLTKLIFTQCEYKNSKIWKKLENLTNLKFLSLDVFSKSSKYQFFENLPKIPTLQYFDSPVIPQVIKTKNLSSLAQKYPNLKEAKFDQVPNINDEFVGKLIELWKDLTTIDLSSFSKDRKITITGIQVIAKNYPNIISLKLQNCSKISDKSLIIISTLQKLKDLKLNICQLSTRGLIYLNKLKKLQRVAICFNHSTSTITLRLLKSLRLFEFQCYNIEKHQQAGLNKQIKENGYEISYGKCVF